ncbi:DUF3343 domain-containing protein [Saccharibacillus kuerlensis]|uniref:Putative Se/S carrier protein-like domain-containing protein n=1 Tax=Saccharibacillus kuerlensis TaxID=459527 RepID=A0ABQ2KWR8_9BACL|nr:DUF3343 domain-containing protein [Saccharibacillus kuerlensis]GGN95187.1 hypothetical protein GCM10010969_10690 [Saccharibacillus kuerlensis]
MDEQNLIIAFDSSQQALRAEMILEEEPIAIELCPTPKEITAGCALCIAFSETEFERVQTIVERERIEIRGIFRKSGPDYNQLT